MAEKNAYVLGTEQAELHRLGLQHQVWATEARKGWILGEFTEGSTILDLGCGPGFCSRDLAYMVGAEGKVIGVDKSQAYIDFLTKLKNLHGLNMDLHCCDFDQMELEPESLDGAFCRWALAWIPNPEEIIQKVIRALKPGGAFVVQEYYNWATFDTEPRLKNLNDIAKPKILKSFQDADGDINIGRRIPEIFSNNDLEVISSRPMTKMATPDQLTWQWPQSFLEIYIPKLTDMGLLTKAEVENALSDLEDLTHNPDATFFCPAMIEVVGVKM